MYNRLWTKTNEEHGAEAKASSELLKSMCGTSFEWRSTGVRAGSEC